MAVDRTPVSIKKGKKEEKGPEVVSQLTHTPQTMLIRVKLQDVFLMGGDPPEDLLISKRELGHLAESPMGFILAIPLPPDHEFSNEELPEMEKGLKTPPGKPFDRKVKGPVVVWTRKAKEPVWSGKALETISSSKTPYIMGGAGTFWPIPLQRHGIYTTVMWRVTLPDLTATFVETLRENIKGTWGELFWTLSKRYDLDPLQKSTLRLT